ncbi:MAG TPA: Crp/Fnr family transcriptional regulator [Candidatus Saccharimonadales bacterium]|nr:Crp/Fnr family transcriptional regulator [Candidatus Saccharimonadales bacterium]
MAEASALQRNKLLAAVPRASLESVAARMTVSAAMRDQVVHRPGEQMDIVMFPLDGLFSLVITDPFGSFTSIATVGREGAIELAPALGSVPVPTEIVCLIGGRIAEMTTDDLRLLIDVSPPFRSAIFRYMGARFVDCVEVSACHRLHPLEARMARCLLTTRDRMERDEFPCTHEQLAGMLGATRPKVSLALEALQRAGTVIHYRGAVRILDPVALEAMTCGCYATIRNAFLAAELPPS